MQNSSLKNLVFHKNDRPRGWVRRLLFKNKGVLKEPRFVFRPLVFKRNGCPRPLFVPWINMGFTARQNFRSSGLDKIRDEIIKNNKLMQVKTVTIMATGHVEYNARVMERWLSVLDIRVRVVIGNISKFNDDLYIVMCPQAFIRLPPRMKRIIFQLEQSGRADSLTDEYMDILTQSLAVFDYSSGNVQFLQDKGILYRDIFELTIAPIADYLPDEKPVAKPVAKSPDFDVLFYGAYNPRRNKILERLGKEFRVKSVCDVYGEEMHDIIRSAPVVVNIHFYENALLETTRISEALSLGARVVSERGIDEDKNRDFAPCVRFCPMDDVEALVAAIKAELAVAEQTPAPMLPIDLMEQAKFRFYRAILALGMVSYKQFCDLTTDWKLPSDKITLSLPENGARREYAMTQNPQDVHIFDGLRHRIGWIGCGMSYKYMAQKALDAGFETLQIHEDDAKFPDNYDESYPVIKEYLAIHKNKWNLFSGMIIVLRDIENIKILDVANYKGLTFVRLNYFTSMVYGIYKGSFLKNMAQYSIQSPSQLSDDDITSGGTHTIDVYLNKLGVECITTLPFMMNQWSDGDSTLWEIGNQEVDQLYKKCQIQMYELVENFKKES